MGTIARSTLTDDDGSGLTGSIFNNSELQKIYDAIETEVKSATNPTVTTKSIIDKVTGSGLLQDVGLTGTQNDIVLTTGVSVVRCTNATLLQINGMAAGIGGQRVLLISVGAGQVDLSPQNTGSAAANRLINFAGNGSSIASSLAAGVGMAEFEYDATTLRWRLVNHEQGAYIAPTYSGGDYTATGGGTFTVDSGDVTTYAYHLRGRRLHVIVDLVTTTTSGTITACNVKLPGGFTATRQVTAIGRKFDTAGGTNVPSTMQVAASGTVIKFSNDLADFANTFGAFTNTLRLGGELDVEVS